MSPLDVVPEQFTTVLFDRDELVATLESLVAAAGLGPDVAVRVEVDERTPLGRARLVEAEPDVVIAVESGAIEEPTHIRHLSTLHVVEVVGRLLVRAADRRSPEFADAPAEGSLTLPQTSAWDAYALGRLGRRGFAPRRQRRLYHFRTRHGFTDAADAAFTRLWEGEDLRWEDVAVLSATARSASVDAT